MSGGNGQKRIHSHKSQAEAAGPFQLDPSRPKAKQFEAAGLVRSSAADGTLMVHVPLTFARRGGRKRIVTPDGTPLAISVPPAESTALVKALARAYRWQRIMEDGEYASLTELAAAEGVTPSYLARILRLTLLAPDIIERIMRRRGSTP